MRVPSVRGHLSDTGHGESMRGHACLKANLRPVLWDVLVFVSCLTLNGLWAMHTVTELCFWMTTFPFLHQGPSPSPYGAGSLPQCPCQPGQPQSCGGWERPWRGALQPHGLLEAQAGAPTVSALLSYYFQLRCFHLAVLSHRNMHFCSLQPVCELHGVIPREVNSSPSAHLYLVRKRYWLSHVWLFATRGL